MRDLLVTRQEIWETALAELQERRKPVGPKSLAECAAKIASDLVYETINHNSHRYLTRHGLTLLRLDETITALLEQINPVAWHGYQTTWRRMSECDLAELIAQMLAVILWNRGLDRGRYHYLFNFTAEEAKSYCPAEQMQLL